MSDIPAPGSISASAENPKQTPERLSDVLQHLLDKSGERVALRDIAEILDDRSFGALLVIFSLPNLIPLPPGATLVLGLPLIFIAWQIVAGRDKVWLPKAIADYKIERKTFEKAVNRVKPWLKRAENWIRPRNWFLRGRAGERGFGAYALLLAIVVVIPIPFGNWLPAFALGLMGVGYTERDGNCVIVGAAVGLLSITVVVAIVVVTGALLAKIV